MASIDNDIIYEGYVGNVLEHNNSNTQYSPKFRGPSNLNQFAGLMGGGKANPARMGSSVDLSAQPSDEESPVVEVKGYGTMRVSQLVELIQRLSNEIQDSIENERYNVGDKADRLKLFADTYRDNS